MDADRRFLTLPARPYAFTSPVDKAVVAVEVKPVRIAGRLGLGLILLPSCRKLKVPGRGGRAGRSLCLPSC